MHPVTRSALVDEIYKIATSTFGQRFSSKAEEENNRNKGLLGAGAGVGAMAGQQWLGATMLSHRMGDPGGVLSKGFEPDMSGAHRVESEVMGPGAYVSGKLNNTYVNEQLRADGMEIPKHKSLIFGPKNMDPAVLSHELGHREINKSRLGRLLQNKFTMTLGAHVPQIGLASGFATGIGSDDKNVHRMGIAAPALAAAPLLAFEGLASLKGLRRLKALGASPQQLSTARKMLGKAFGTYALDAGMGVGGAVAGQAVGQHFRHSED